MGRAFVRSLRLLEFFLVSIPSLSVVQQCLLTHAARLSGNSLRHKLLVILGSALSATKQYDRAQEVYSEILQRESQNVPALIVRMGGGRMSLAQDVSDSSDSTLRFRYQRHPDARFCCVDV